MAQFKKNCILIITIIALLASYGEHSTVAAASSIYSTCYVEFGRKNITLYENMGSYFVSASVGYSLGNYQSGAYEKAVNKIENNLKWTSSNPSVAQFLIKKDGYTLNDTKTSTTGQSVDIMPLSCGTTTIKIKSSILKTTLSCKVTVKYASITCDDSYFYPKSNYKFSLEGNDSAASFSSSDTKVASVHPTSGVLKTKKTGTTTLTCIGKSGRKYTYKVSVKKAGLSYKKLTVYHYTGMKKGSYSGFPLIAKGISVKKWKSSNSNICKIKSYGSFCELQPRKTGKCTITCIGKNNKKYKCKLTVAGGKTWGGLNSGYRPTVSSLKKHGYYKDINTIKDYGKVVVVITSNKTNLLKNGNKKLNMSVFSLNNKATAILKDRYPNSTIHYLSVGDYLCYANNSRTKSDVISRACYYVK